MAKRSEPTTGGQPGVNGSAVSGEQTKCDLVERNRSGSGPDTPSLAVVRTVERPELLITERDSEQLANWQQRADAIAAQPSLFDDPETDKPQF